MYNFIKVLLQETGFTDFERFIPVLQLFLVAIVVVIFTNLVWFMVEYSLDYLTRIEE